MGEKRRAEEKLRTQIDGSQKTLQRAIGAGVFALAAVTRRAS